MTNSNIKVGISDFVLVLILTLCLGGTTDNLKAIKVCIPIRTKNEKANMKNKNKSYTTKYLQE